MNCPDPKCQYVGFSPTGLCPKCGEKLLPDMPFYQAHKKSHPIKSAVHFLIQLGSRIFESALIYLLAYLSLWVTVYLYNVLSEEVPTWDPIDFTSQTMIKVKIGLFIVILFWVLKFRWRKRWV